MKIVLGLLCLAIFASFVSADIIINEVMYNPDQCDDNYCEYLELYNNGSEMVNLSGYLISDMNSALSIEYNRTLNFVNGSILNFSMYFNIAKNINNFTYYFNKYPNASSNFVLNNDNDILRLYNSSGFKIFEIYYNTSFGANGNNKSLQYCNGNWIENTPTPGFTNNCTTWINTSNSTCTASYTCGSWSSCSHNRQTRACTNFSTSCINTTINENKTCSNADDIELDFSWTDEDIINNQEFTISLEANNLEDLDYDVKVWLESDEEDIDLKSEIYDEDSAKWESSTYFIKNFFTGDGDKTGNINLRIKSEYNDFTGDASIFFKLRETDSGDIIDTINDSIEILQGEENNTTDIAIDTTLTTSSSSLEANTTISTNKTRKTEGIKIQENSMYLSRTELIKKYAPYAFSILCICLLGLIILDSNKKNNSKKQ